MDFSAIFDDFLSFLQVPNLDDIPMNVFFQDLFQLIASWFGSLFSGQWADTWDTIWNRVVVWNGWPTL